jgi:carotenoid cleavage dioxygenase
MTVTENPFLAGNYGPVREERTETDLPSTARCRRPARPLPAHRPEPVHAAGGPLPLVSRRRDGARRRARGRRGRWYRNRWVRTDEIARALGEQPVSGPTPPLYDASNTHVSGTRAGSTR